MGVYIGINNIAKKVSSLYIGVNNIARKVKSGYIGVNNIASSFLSSGSGVDPTKTEYTEAEINALAAFGEINLIPLDSKVTIGNTQDTLRTIHTYRVIGKDHQDLNIDNYGSTGTVEAGTAPAIGTVDLWATSVITKRVFKSSNPTGQYNDSDIRTWLNGDYYNGFNDITKTHMKTMVVEYYYTSGNLIYNAQYAKGNNNTNDKVKLLSVKEFNCSTFSQEMHQREGNGYEYFPSVPYGRNNNYTMKRYADETGTGGVSYQWCRSLCCNADLSGRYPWRIWTGGSISVNYGGGGNYSYAIVPCFRLGA